MLKIYWNYSIRETAKELGILRNLAVEDDQYYEQRMYMVVGSL